MTRDEYLRAVATEQWPSDPRVPTAIDFEDERGTISNLVLLGMNSVSEIRSRRSAVRANHYHQTDWHFTYVVSGAVYYFERAIGEREIPKPTLFVVGDMFFTPPMREHAMLFSDDSTILTFARNSRDHENHEADVVRVDLVDAETARRVIHHESTASSR